MCVAVRLATGWLTTAVASVEQRERQKKRQKERDSEAERGSERQRERESHLQIRSNRKIECTKEKVCKRQHDREKEGDRDSNRQPTVTGAVKAAFDSTSSHLVYSPIYVFSLFSVLVSQAAKTFALPPSLCPSVGT